MFMRNGAFTFEESVILQSLKCKDKAQAIEELEMIEKPEDPELLSILDSLIIKLKTEHIDYKYEMKEEIGFFDDEMEEMPE